MYMFGYVCEYKCTCLGTCVSVSVHVGGMCVSTIAHIWITGYVSEYN